MNFGVDHFRPKSLFRNLICTYSNLYYACNLCNSFKGQTWPSDALKAKGFVFADPCESNVYETHLKEEDDGSLQCLTTCGKYTYEHLDLDRDDLVNWRRERRLARNDLPEVDRMIKEMGDTISKLRGRDKKLLDRRYRVLIRCRARLERDAR